MPPSSALQAAPASAGTSVESLGTSGGQPASRVTAAEPSTTIRPPMSSTSGPTLEVLQDWARTDYPVLYELGAQSKCPGFNFPDTDKESTTPTSRVNDGSSGSTEDLQNFDVAIGLPSYNEAETIAFITETVDLGCQAYFPGRRCVLVNMDCRSTDSTRDTFLGTATKSEKRCMVTAQQAQGKGAALHLLFEFMAQHRIPFGASIDTDLKQLCPMWLQSFSDAFERGCDMATPRYSRHRCDGLITNLAVYPTVCAVFGQDVRQPIGGDFALCLQSSRGAGLLGSEWTTSTYKYGIDIHTTTSVLKEGYKMVEMCLPARRRSSSWGSASKSRRWL